MKSLQLLPGKHRQKEIVEVRFPYGLQLMAKLKEQRGKGKKDRITLFCHTCIRTGNRLKIYSETFGS